MIIVSRKFIPLFRRSTMIKRVLVFLCVAFLINASDSGSASHVSQAAPHDSDSDDDAHKRIGVLASDAEKRAFGTFFQLTGERAASLTREDIFLTLACLGLEELEKKVPAPQQTSGTEIDGQKRKSISPRQALEGASAARALLATLVGQCPRDFFPGKSNVALMQENIAARNQFYRKIPIAERIENLKHMCERITSCAHDVASGNVNSDSLGTNHPFVFSETPWEFVENVNSFLERCFSEYYLERVDKQCERIRQETLGLRSRLQQAIALQNQHGAYFAALPMTPDENGFLQAVQESRASSALAMHTMYLAAMRRLVAKQQKLGGKALVNEQGLVYADKRQALPIYHYNTLTDRLWYRTSNLLKDEEGIDVYAEQDIAFINVTYIPTVLARSACGHYSQFLSGSDSQLTAEEREGVALLRQLQGRTSISAPAPDASGAEGAGVGSPAAGASGDDNV